MPGIKSTRFGAPAASESKHATATETRGKDRLKPIAGLLHDHLHSISTGQYIELVAWSATIYCPGKHHLESPSAALQTMGCDEAEWKEQLDAVRCGWRVARQRRSAAGGERLAYFEVNADGKATELKKFGGFVVSGTWRNRCRSSIRVHRDEAESDIGADASAIALEDLQNSGGEGLGLMRGRFDDRPEAAPKWHGRPGKHVVISSIAGCWHRLVGAAF